MNLNQLFSSDFGYEISAAGVHQMSPNMVGFILGTTMDGANNITLDFNTGNPIVCTDYLLKQVPYAIKPKTITITGTVKVWVFEKVNSQ